MNVVYRCRSSPEVFSLPVDFGEYQACFSVLTTDSQAVEAIDL